MRDVNIVGAGMTEFGTHPDRSVKKLTADACYDALTSSGVPKEDLEFACCGNFVSALLGEQGKAIGQLGLRELGVTGIPVVNVENGGATGAQAFREAWKMIASGMADVAIAMGVEKMNQVDAGYLLEAMANAGDLELEGANGISWPGLFGMVTRRRMHDLGTPRDPLATVSVIHHDNACNNPYAQRQKQLTESEVLDGPTIADPLKTYEVCPRSDGAAAAVLASEDVARSYTDTPVRTLETIQTSGDYRDDVTIHHVNAAAGAADHLYNSAGVGPDDIDVVEIHDAFSVEVPIYLEGLGFCPEGEGEQLVAEGQTRIDGDIPYCPSGGLLARGHPIGATGLSQICEIFWQLRGEAGDRQVDGAEIGLTQISGQFLHTDYGCVILNLFDV
jgi:acetyl-CoA C-acetyltransferase